MSSAGLSLLGDQFQALALSWVVLTVTGSAASLGIVLASGAIPRAALMLVGGVAADRIGPRRVLILAALGRALAVPALILSLDAKNLTAICLVEAALGTVGAFFYPADASMMPRLGLRGSSLQRANATLQVIMQTANTGGPAAAGVVVAWTTGRTSLLVAAAAYALAGLVLLLVQSSMDGSGIAQRRPRARMLSGFADVIRNRGLTALLMTVAAVNLCTTGLFSVGLPTLVRSVLHERASVYGIASFSFAGGSLLGALLLRFMRLRRRGVVVLACVVGLIAMLGSVAAVSADWQLVVILAAAGICSGIANVLLVTQLQSVAPPEAIGRVMSVVMLASLGTAPIAQLVGGYLASGVGTRGTFVILAGAGLVVTAVSGRNIVAVDRIAHAEGQ